MIILSFVQTFYSEIFLIKQNFQNKISKIRFLEQNIRNMKCILEFLEYMIISKQIFKNKLNSF